MIGNMESLYEIDIPVDLVLETAESDKLDVNHLLLKA